MKDPTTIVKITTAISKNVLFRLKIVIPKYIAYNHWKQSEAYIHEKILNANRSQPFGGTGQRSDIKGELGKLIDKTSRIVASHSDQFIHG